MIYKPIYRLLSSIFLFCSRTLCLPAGSLRSNAPVYTVTTGYKPVLPHRLPEHVQPPAGSIQLRPTAAKRIGPNSCMRQQRCAHFHSARWLSATVSATATHRACNGSFLASTGISTGRINLPRRLLPATVLSVSRAPAVLRALHPPRVAGRLRMLPETGCRDAGRDEKYRACRLSLRR